MGTAAILFALAAFGGAVMVAMRLGGKDLPPTALAVGHGVIAAAGLVTLIAAVKGGAVPALANVALAGFVLAALGGAGLFFLYHMKHRALPMPLMLVHGTVAVLSFAVLLIAVFSS
ncbi:hypothetical protein [Geobacter sp. DSM 9736]|uniref:hypothetical protein n=1 Tax=Geobacter sp. DSM 9736 TaxID=1277350 RepID=UPI000B510443|nr:hypothetical protein [Geobacter sp. DSM 9736]SNB44672.1 hypothetical protein SAMN06269301_0059 [Geobacter sp. DSM 9736]